MLIASANLANHDTGVTIIEDGVVTKTILSERVSRIKHGGNILSNFENTVGDIEKYKKISISLFNPAPNGIQLRKDQYPYFLEEARPDKFRVDIEDHHLCHAYCGYYTSNFDEAVVFVMDGNGSFVTSVIGGMILMEGASVYTFKNGRVDRIIYKEYVTVDSEKKRMYGGYPPGNDIKLNESNIISGRLTLGHHYASTCLKLGLGDEFAAGKLMGLAQYKTHEEKLSSDYQSDEWIYKVNQAHLMQKNAEDRIESFLDKYVESTGITNVIVSGGVFLNCVATYKLLNKKYNLHVDPVCNDNGISIGNALKCCLDEGIIPKRIPNVYLGYQEEDLEDKIRQSNLEIIESVTYKQVVDIICHGDAVALFQGRSEIGQRALGNRSILFDPRVEDGKTLVNKIKKREDYRPFAASVMAEYANQWFDMRGIDQSPFMSYAVDAYDNTIEKVPAVIHADNTCRIQTVSEQQNYHFYNLIKEFASQTNIHMLLNTSFNLGGQPLVETFDDAVYTLKNSELKYLYLPEQKILCVDS